MPLEKEIENIYNILIVDDDPIECDSLAELLKYEGYFIETACNGKIASEKLKQKLFNVVVTDVNMTEVTGFDLLKHISENYPKSSVILITGYGQIEDAVSAIKLGAYDYIMKPFKDDKIRMLVRQAIKRPDLQNIELERHTSVSLDDVIGQDKEIRKIRELIKIVANRNATILITGENGTGKSLIAKAIHYNSSRNDKQYVEIPCGSIPDTLLDSELFGHSKGSFTDAIKEKPGRFELANGGTILLDEIDTTKSSFQVKLLRFLQDKKFERLGSLKTITTDVRMIVSTSSNLKDETEKGNFRKDLYYRINVIPINIPPLRKRRSDIKLLADHFLNKYCIMYKKKKLRISDETMYRFQNYTWPGNVRELENIIQRGVITATREYINVNDMSFAKYEAAPNSKSIGTFSLKKAMEKPERDHIESTLEHFNWNKNKTARVLQLNRTTLYKKMKKYSMTFRKP
ncbi:MAG: sigma-54-dependent transcriptional regulator [Candidatus Scalinduaceae bacterium]